MGTNTGERRRLSEGFARSSTRIFGRSVISRFLVQSANVQVVTEQGHPRQRSNLRSWLHAQSGFHFSPFHLKAFLKFFDLLSADFSPFEDLSGVANFGQSQVTHFSSFYFADPWYQNLERTVNYFLFAVRPQS